MKIAIKKQKKMKLLYCASTSTVKAYISIFDKGVSFHKRNCCAVLMGTERNVGFIKTIHKRRDPFKNLLKLRGHRIKWNGNFRKVWSTSGGCLV